MSIFVVISLLNAQLFYTAVHTGVTIWMMPLSPHHCEAISKTSRWLLYRIKKNHFHSILLAKTSPSSNGVFFVSYYWLKHKTPEGSDAYYTANNAAHKTSLLKPFYILLDQKKNNEHKSNEIRDLEADMFPKIHCGLSRTQKAQEHNNCSDKPVFHTLFKGSLFFSLCDYLFICLLIYFSLPRVQRACVWCALMAISTKGEGMLLLHSGQREEKETCLLICGNIIKASD